MSRNVDNSLSKITQNLDEIPKNESPNNKLNEEEPHEESHHEADKTNGPKKKSKNYKISIEATELMNQWLLRNFEAPYPSL